MINGNLWRVRFSRKPGGYSIKEVFGVCCPDDRLIEIAVGIAVKERWDTFVHEVIHALEFEYREEIPKLQKLLDHKLINLVEAPIAKMILENFAHQ